MVNYYEKNSRDTEDTKFMSPTEPVAHSMALEIEQLLVRVRAVFIFA